MHDCVLIHSYHDDTSVMPLPLLWRRGQVVNAVIGELFRESEAVMRSERTDLPLYRGSLSWTAQQKPRPRRRSHLLAVAPAGWSCPGFSVTRHGEQTERPSAAGLARHSRL